VETPLTQSIRTEKEERLTGKSKPSDLFGGFSSQSHFLFPCSHSNFCLSLHHHAIFESSRQGFGALGSEFGLFGAERFRYVLGLTVNRSRVGGQLAMGAAGTPIGRTLRSFFIIMLALKCIHGYFVPEYHLLLTLLYSHESFCWID
jgi:hypothetical protein